MVTKATLAVNDKWYYTHMSEKFRMSNEEVLAILKEVLAAMEVKEVNRFRIRAYQNVISAIEDLTSSIYDLWQQNRLDEVYGVGSTLKDHLTQLFTKGKVKDFDEVKKDLPDGMFGLLGLRGIGAKKAFKLATQFSLTDRTTAIEGIKKAAKQGKIQVLEGFGEKSEKLILEAVSELKQQKNEKQRMLLNKAEEIADRLVTYMKQLDCVTQVQALGSLRRREATIGDLDIALATTNGEQVIKHFTAFPEVADVTAKGDSRAAIVTTTDVQVDIRVVKPEAYGAMVQYFTGSKQHNIVLRTYALEKGYSISEYGIKDKTGTIHEFSTEADFYNFLDLDYIPPYLRQGKNEVDLARKKQLPPLVALTDIQGDLHTHTTDSDGANTLEEMTEAAVAKGYKYLGITDHSPSVISRGRYDVLGIMQQKREKIEQLNSSQELIRVLFGYEVNILKDATLALPNDILSKLDYVIAAIHTSFDQTREEITNRFISAIENPYVKIIAHPSGRILNDRKPMEVDWEKVFSAVLKHNKILEINSQPSRLDLAEDLVKDAKNLGIKLVINTDAHSVGELNNMKYGIDVASRGWCTSANIINTLSYQEISEILGVKK